MREFGPFEEKVIRKYTKILLEVIIYMHRLNIVHRDIRCSNILSDCKGNIKLSGFCNAKLLENGLILDPEQS